MMNSLEKTSFSITRLIPLYIVIFVGFIGFSLLVTVFTPIILNPNSGFLSNIPTGTRAVWLGILLSMYPLGQFFGSPVMGALSDHFGRKPVLLISLSVTTLAYIGIALSLNFFNTTSLMVSTLIAGFAEANIVTAQSAIADVTANAPQHRGRLFGYIYMSASLAFVVGPLCGGKLVDPHIVSWFNDATPFWIVCILLFVLAVLILFSFEETNKNTSQHGFDYFNAFIGLKNLFTHPIARPYFLINFFFYIAIFGFFSCYPMYMVKQFHFTVSQESLFIAWTAVPIILGNLWLTGFLSKYMSQKSLTLYSAILMGIACVVIVIPKVESSLWITLFLTGLGTALCMPACATFLSLAISEKEQGSVMGNNQAIQVGAQAISAILSGVLTAIWLNLALIIWGVMALVGSLLLIILFYLRK